MKRSVGALAAAVAAASCAASGSEPQSADAGLRVHADGAAPVASEYRQVFTARGVDPAWTGEIRPGAARVRVEGQQERVVPLLEPRPCFVIGCEGVMIEQRVSHRHHGASILKGPCRLPGSDTEHPYRVTISVLQGPSDTRGTTYKGCASPAGR